MLTRVGAPDRCKRWRVGKIMERLSTRGAKFKGNRELSRTYEGEAGARWGIPEPKRVGSAGGAIGWFETEKPRLLED